MEQLQTIRIEIEDCGEFARCEVPAFGQMYGRSVQDIKETLDLLEEAGYFRGLFQISATLT